MGGRLTDGLSLWVEGVYVHWEVELVVDRGDGHVARELVGLVDALGVPVCPVQLILKHGDGKRVGQTCVTQHTHHHVYHLPHSV